MRRRWGFAFVHIVGALLALSVSATAGPLEDAAAATSRKDYDAALRILRPLAQHGDPRAQTELGRLIEEGRGAPKDEGEAVVWYRRAAEQGFARAQNRLGVMYAKGRGVAQNDGEAVNWYKKAAEQSLSAAQVNLGQHYKSGKGVPRDFSQAANWFARAADQGHLRAQYLLGLAYERGEGLAVNLYRAIELYDRVLRRVQDSEFRSSVLLARSRVASQIGAMPRAQAPAAQSVVPKPSPPSKPRRAARPSPTTSCEAGLSIEAVSDDGHIVKLDDSSIWEVDIADRLTVSTWTVASDVVACDGKLVNVDDNETAHAVRLQ